MKKSRRYCVKCKKVTTFKLKINKTANQLEKRIIECKPNTAIIFDEGFSGLSSKGAISKENKSVKHRTR